MTMMSLRVADHEAGQAQRWADQLGIDKSELLRDALHPHLVLLASERDAASWIGQPLTSAEDSIREIADWGPAEDWSDWADAAG